MAIWMIFQRIKIIQLSNEKHTLNHEKHTAKLMKGSTEVYTIHGVEAVGRKGGYTTFWKGNERVMVREDVFDRIDFKKGGKNE